jgi:putative ABC transport system permease protein
LTVFPLLRIAFRNLLRAKRRNLLSGGTMALGAAALVLGNGLSDGIAGRLTDNLVAVQTGHLQVVARSEDFRPQNNPFDAYSEERLPGAVALARRIEAEGNEVGVARALPFLHGRGTALAGRRSSMAVIVGIDPERESELQAAQPPEAGRFLPGDDPLAVYIAAPMAHKLHLGVGDTVSFVVQTAQGAVNSTDAVVCGIFRKSAPWYDNTFYLPLPAAQALFDWTADATNVKVMLTDARPTALLRARQVVERIVAAAPTEGLRRGARVRVESFQEAGRFSFSIIQTNGAALFILSSFLFAAAAVGVVNAMLMSVHERTREIGTVRALGLRRSGVVRLFVLEGVILGAMAAAAGVALGGALVLHYGARGIPMNTVTLTWLAGGDALFPVLRLPSVTRAALAIASLSMLASFYPAWTASRLEPREALHHV